MISRVNKEKDGPLSHDPAIWLFFLHTSKIVPKHFNDAQRLEVKKILQEISPSALAEYYNAFNYSSGTKSFLKEISPSQIIELFSLYITKQKAPKDSEEKTLSDIWDKLKDAHGLQNMCQLCFLEASPWFGLTIYSYLSECERFEILAAMSEDRAQASRIFANWCMLGLSPEAQMELSPSIKLFVSFELRKLLAKMEPSLSALLKAELENRQIGAQNLTHLFPEACTPQQRQEQALDQLEQLFSREDIDHNKLRPLINGLTEDLKANREVASWALRLFERLPKQMWPLLFVYFNHDLCIRPYDHYREEKTRGGMFKMACNQSVDSSWKEKLPVQAQAVLRLSETEAQKRISQLPLHAPKWLPSTEKWVDLAARTLVEVAQNPLINEVEKNSALQHLYQAICETKTIDLVISHFCKIAPAQKWILALDALQRSSFYYNKDEFYEFIAKQLSDLNFPEEIEDRKDQPLQDKVDFIADRFVAFDLSEPSDLAHELFDKPFIKTPEEASELVNYLINRTGINFLGYFLNRSVNTSALVKGVKSRKNGGQATFLNWVQALASASNENRLKISILESIGACYVEKSPEEFIALLQDPQFAVVAEEIYLWYSTDADTLIHIRFSEVGWRLLSHFAPEAFYPTVFAKLLHLQQKEKWFEIELFLDTLSNLSCSEELAKRLLTEDSLSNFRTAFQQHVKDEGIDRVVSSCIKFSAIGQTLLFQLIPDWSSELIEKATQILNKEYKETISYSDREGSFYYELTSLYRSLDRAGVLASWLPSFEATLPEKIKPAFLESEQIYRRQAAKEDTL